MEADLSASPTYTVRRAEASDLAAIAGIYDDAVLNSTATFDVEPWTEAERGRWLRGHSHPYTILVAINGDELVGWASLSPFRSKSAYRLTVEDTVYVRANMQTKGIGRLLLGRLLEVAAENGFRTVIARIAAGNPASEQLHRRFGFRRVGVEREVGYKFNRWLDVVVMQKMLAG